MKKFKSLMMAALAVMASIALASCSDDDDNSPIGSKEDLIGRWEKIHETGWEKEDGDIVDEWDGLTEKWRIDFYADGTCTGWACYGNKWHEDQYGSYIYKNGVITLKYDDWGDDLDVGKVKKLTATELELEASNSEWDEGVKYEYYNYVTYRKIADFDEAK